MDLGKKIAILMLLATIAISVKMIRDQNSALEPDVTGQSSSWLYRRAIRIENEKVFTLREERVEIVIDTEELISSGKLLPNCNDIRFLDDDVAIPLKYKIGGEKGKYGDFSQEYIQEGIKEEVCGNKETKIWVDIPIIEPGGKTIYFLYGNNNAIPLLNN